MQCAQIVSHADRQLAHAACQTPFGRTTSLPDAADCRTAIIRAKSHLLLAQGLSLRCGSFTVFVSLRRSHSTALTSALVEPGRSMAERQ